MLAGIAVQPHTIAALCLPPPLLKSLSAGARVAEFAVIPFRPVLVSSANFVLVEVRPACKTAADG